MSPENRVRLFVVASFLVLGVAVAVGFWFVTAASPTVLFATILVVGAAVTLGFKLGRHIEYRR
jgi:hypothetical protein